MKHNVIVTAGLTNYKLSTKLAGLIHNSEVETVYLVRKRPIEGLSNKLVNINPSVGLLRWLPFYELWRFFTLISLCKRHQVSAVIGIQLVIHGVQAAICSVFTKTPAVLSVIGTDVHKHLLTPEIRGWLKPFVRQMKNVTVMGNKSKSIISGLGVPVERITTIQNYQDTSKFQKTDAEKKWDIAFVGELITRKCVPDLLLAISQSEDPYSLVIVGDGEERENLAKIVTELGLDRQVEFVGNVSNVGDYLNQSRCMVLPSKLEALPAVSIEAMYCGVPSILTSICDIPTYFSHEQGCMIYTVGDIKTLQKYLCKLLNDEEYYAQVASHCDSWASQHRRDWSLERQCKIWSDILDKVNCAA